MPLSSFSSRLRSPLSFLLSSWRGLTIWHGGSPTNGQKRNLSKKPPSVLADVRPSGSAGDSATARLWTAVFRLVAYGVCLSRRAQRADLYKTSTREGAKAVIKYRCGRPIMVALESYLNLTSVVACHAAYSKNGITKIPKSPVQYGETNIRFI